MTELYDVTEAILDISEGDSVYSFLEEMNWGKEKDSIELPLGKLAVEDSYGGEGQGDRYYIVVSLTHSDGTVEYFQYNGFYSSWEGVDWEDFEDEKVIPQEKTIIEWVKE